MSGFLGSLVNGAMGAFGGQFEKKFGSSISEFLGNGGLQTLLAQARSAGLEEKVHSWIGNGQNLPITVDQVRNLLNSQQVEALVAKTGLPAETILPAIAEFLPKAVDNHTPEGTVPPAAA